MGRTTFTIFGMLAAVLLLTREAASQGSGSRDPDYDDGKYQIEELGFSEELLDAIEHHRDVVKDESKSAVRGACKAGFSTTKYGQKSLGGPQLLEYGTPITHDPSWMFDRIFFAPCDGLHKFSVTFVRDATGMPTQDVFIYIMHNFAGKGYAMAGESSEPRETGAYNVVLKLKAGDLVHTEVHSDGGVLRRLFKYSFSGHLITEC